MKKYLILAAVLIAHAFAAEGVPLTARFINSEDLLDASPIQLALKGFVGADTEEKWNSAKQTMEGQIATNAMRRVLFFRGNELVTSTRSGRMPLHIYPATDNNGSYEFTNGQENIANVYRWLVSDMQTVEDLFQKPNFNDGLTWRIRTVAEGNDPEEILAVTLMSNGVTDASLIAEMHKVAFELFRGMYLVESTERLPSLYISMVNNVLEIETVDFGDNLTLQLGLHNYFPADEDGRSYLVTGKINN